MQIEISGLSSPDAPVLVLSAGLGGLGNFWAPQRASLEGRFRLVSYDHAGTGNNPASLPEGYCLQDMARELADALAAHGIERFSLLGHALGGLIGLQLAADYPERVISLVVVNGWLTLNAHTRRCFRVRQDLLLNSGVEAFVRAQPLFLYPADWLAEHQQQAEADDIRHLNHFQGTGNLLRRLSALMDADFSTIAPGLTLPVLLMYSRDDLLVPWGCSLALKAALPQAFSLEMARGGHAMSVTCSGEFTERLLPWLQQYAIV